MFRDFYLIFFLSHSPTNRILNSDAVLYIAKSRSFKNKNGNTTRCDSIAVKNIKVKFKRSGTIKFNKKHIYVIKYETWLMSILQKEISMPAYQLTELASIYLCTYIYSFLSSALMHTRRVSQTQSHHFHYSSRADQIFEQISCQSFVLLCLLITTKWNSIFHYIHLIIISFFHFVCLNTLRIVINKIHTISTHSQWKYLQDNLIPKSRISRTGKCGKWFRNATHINLISSSPHLQLSFSILI